MITIISPPRISTTHTRIDTGHTTTTSHVRCAALHPPFVSISTTMQR
jgi:hypothetical protein